MQSSIRVTLVGQSAIVREGLRRILFDEQFDVRQSVDDPALLSDDGVNDDLVILIDGDCATCSADAIEDLYRRFPAVKVVVLSEKFDFNAMAAAFRAGSHGYLLKELSREALVGSLKLVAVGEKVLPSCLVDELPRRAEAGARDDARQLLKGAHLSSREQEILGCLIGGYSNKIISRRLAISEATVKVHVKAILRKMQVKNRTQAAIHAVNSGWSNLSPPAGKPGPDPKGPARYGPRLGGRSGLN